MKEYKLDFYESYARTEYIQAESLEDALEMAKDMWRSGSVEITNNEFIVTVADKLRLEIAKQPV